MGFMEFLQEASKNDLIDIIISLQSQLGEEITEERFSKKNKWPLVQIFISLEDSVHCGHPPNVPDIGVVRTLKEFFRRCQNDTETFKEYLDNVKILYRLSGYEKNYFECAGQRGISRCRCTALLSNLLASSF